MRLVALSLLSLSFLAGTSFGFAQNSASVSGSSPVASQGPAGTLATTPVPATLPLRLEIDSIVSKGPLHLRTRNNPNSEGHFLLSWDPENGGELTLREVSAQGFLVQEFKKGIGKKTFLDILFESGKVEFNANANFKVVSALRRGKLSNGTSKISFTGNFALAKDAPPKELEFDFDLLIMNLNPLNLWDANPDNTNLERMYGYDLFSKDLSNWYNPRIQVAKAESVVQSILLAGMPDVIALQELEYANGLSQVFAAGSPLREKLQKLGYRSFLLGKQGSENSVSITTGFLSRYALVEMPSIDFNVKDEAFRLLSERERKSVQFSTRDIQVVELNLGMARTRFLNTHWRSKGCSGEESCDLSERVRIVNAEVLRRQLDAMRKQDSELSFIVMGDFNSAYDDSTLQKLGSVGEKEKVMGGHAGNVSLFNLWFDIPKAERWEHEFQGERNTLSQMLLSPHFFGTRGIQYVNHSFWVVGQRGVARSVLMNPNDTPFRWQESRLKLDEVPATKRELIRTVLTERGCFDKKKTSRRKCAAAYTEHTGVGFSNHLPQVARLSFVGDDLTEVAPQFSKKPRDEFEKDNESVCSFASAPAVGGLEFWKPEHRGKCVSLDFVGAPQPLRTRGVYEYGYVLVRGNMLGITMNGAYNPKPRSVLGGEKSSDMCFARKVLQHDGGKVLRAVGKLGFDNGLPTIFLAERNDIFLVELPKEKQLACE